MPKFALSILLAVTLAAQDKITITVQRGTQTRTAEISGAVVVDVFKALDSNVAVGGGNNETDALRKILIGQFVSILHNLAGHPIQQASAAYRAAVDGFTTAAEATPIK